MSSVRRSLKIRALVISAVATAGLAAGAVAASDGIDFSAHSLRQSPSFSAAHSLKSINAHSLVSTEAHSL